MVPKKLIKMSYMVLTPLNILELMRKNYAREPKKRRRKDNLTWINKTGPLPVLP